MPSSPDLHSLHNINTGRLLAQLELGDVPLIGVVHELVDNEPQEFQRAAFNGNHHIIHDSSKVKQGNTFARNAPLLTFIRAHVHTPDSPSMLGTLDSTGRGCASARNCASLGACVARVCRGR